MDAMMGLLFQGHAQMTLNKPLLYNEVNIKNCIIPESEEQFDICWNEALKKFNETTQLKGTINCDPNFWARVCLSKIIEARDNGDDVAKIPNGCCTNDQCPLKKFYELLTAELSQPKSLG